MLNPAAREGQEIRTYVRLNKYFPFRDKKSLKILKEGSQNPLIEEEHPTPWQKDNGEKDKQRSTKHAHKTKD